MKKTTQKKISPALIARDENDEKRAPSDIAKRSLVIIGKVLGFSKSSKVFSDGKTSNSTAFRGIFEAEEKGPDGKTVAIHTSTKLSLPSFIETELESAFKEAALGDSLSASVDIAVKIGAKARKELPTGYEWTAENLLPPQSDPFAAIRATPAPNASPALPDNGNA